MLASRGGLGDDDLSRERRAWNSVLFRGPRSQIPDLATFRTERTPGIIVPTRGLVT